MTLSKYDKASYIKHPSLTLQGADFVSLESKLSSPNLLIKWHCSRIHIVQDKYQSQQKNTIITFNGSCEKRVNTPMGHLFPEQHSLKIAVENNKLIEPLQLTNVDYEYSLFFQNPTNVRMSHLEVWEFKG